MNAARMNTGKLVSKEGREDVGIVLSTEDRRTGEDMLTECWIWWGGTNNEYSWEYIGDLNFVARGELVTA